MPDSVPCLFDVSALCVYRCGCHQKVSFCLHPQALHSTRWNKLKAIVGNRLQFREVHKPTHVFGSPIGNVYHANDVYKINVALKEGGIFVDEDTFIVKNLNHLRQYEVGNVLCRQKLLSKPKS